MIRYKTSPNGDGWWSVRCLQEGEIIGRIRNTGRRQWAAVAQDGTVLAFCATDRDHAIRMVETHHGRSKMPKYPEVEVQLTGEDGNVFMIIGRVGRALRQGVGGEAKDQFMNEAMACDSYADVLNLVNEWVSVS